MSQSIVREAQISHSCLGKSVANFLELIKLLAQCDVVLANHIATAPRNANYLSPHIQNELIKSIADILKDRILSEVKQAHYFGIIMDSTIDISNMD